MISGNFLRDRMWEKKFRRPGILYSYTGEPLPGEIQKNLDKAKWERELGPFRFGKQASTQGWQELLYSPIADGTAITAAAATAMVPDFNLPANYMTIGRTLRYTVYFRVSTVITTPGTQTLSLRWGGTGGVTLATSGGYAPDTAGASTNLTGWVEYLVVCRSTGTSGTAMCCGNMFLGDFNTTSTATMAANLAMHPIPATAPAVATIDTTIAKAITPTYTESAATGSLTAHIAILESLN